jgi:hypothetical protein
MLTLLQPKPIHLRHVDEILRGLRRWLPWRMAMQPCSRAEDEALGELSVRNFHRIYRGKGKVKRKEERNETVPTSAEILGSSGRSFHRNYVLSLFSATARRLPILLLHMVPFPATICSLCLSREPIVNMQTFDTNKQRRQRES